MHVVDSVGTLNCATNPSYPDTEPRMSRIKTRTRPSVSGSTVAKTHFSNQNNNSLSDDSNSSSSDKLSKSESVSSSDSSSNSACCRLFPHKLTGLSFCLLPQG